MTGFKEGCCDGGGHIAFVTLGAAVVKREKIQLLAGMLTATCGFIPHITIHSLSQFLVKCCGKSAFVSEHSGV